MFPHTPDHLLPFGLTVIALGLAVGAPSVASHEADVSSTDPAPLEAAVVPGGAAEARDTAQVGDRRCLTRRPEDCLAEPVPADEPHGAVCAVCHDLWNKDQTLVQSARACSGGECHSDPEELAPFHSTVPADVLDACTGCHLPHGFRVEGGGEDCLVCHTSGGSLVPWAGAAPPLTIQPGLDFSHAEHGSVGCATCHGVEARHGTLAVMDREDCRSCHHERPLVDNCTSCHVASEVRSTSFEVTKPLEIRIGSLDRPVRTIVFDHSNHWHTDCGVCHTGGIDLETALGADCSGCHLEHHEPTATCTTCHAAPAAGAHDVDAHFGCGGAGCHDPVPDGIRSAPRTREVCLACHTGYADHKRGENCSDCHVLPPPRS